MHRFENQIVSKEHCPVQKCPAEWRNSLEFTQNSILRDLEFENCEFIGEGLATYGEAINRSTAQNIRLKNCVMNSFFGIGAIFDDIVVDGLKTSRAPVTFFGCALRQVVLKGKCGRFLFNRNVCRDDQRRDASFESANADFYRDVDWAIDISELNTAGLEIRGTIPSRLIRRNPEVHFIMTRTVALEGDWKNYEPFDSFQISVSTFLDSSAEDNLFVAPKQSKGFKEQVEYFHRLKLAGLVT